MLHTEKRGQAVLPYAFIMAFPTSPETVHLPQGSHPKKNCLLLDIVQKVVGVKPEYKTFGVVLFGLLLDLLEEREGG